MKCLKCAQEIGDEKEYAYHVKVCQLSAMGCKECLITFSAKKYYLQHIKRVHMIPTILEKRVVERNENVRKRCSSLPPSAYMKKPKLDPCTVTVQAVTHQESPPATVPPH